ncbi:hypothetical protein AAHZ94_08775 [Streptomyces sp. HSW2009]|uniref:hypothetical protein n=1 Tax=Streptomyces sp. HSW2009 TaxID=3142890 RepID=UPI0032EB4C53
MLKKALTAIAMAGAATAAVAGASPASASDTSGGDYSQNVNLLPHACIDIDRINVGLVNVPIDLLNDNDAINCDEIRDSQVVKEDKGTLSDVADIGAYQR